MRHILWLAGNSVKELLCGNIDAAYEAYCLIKVHLTYPHKRIR